MADEILGSLGIEIQADYSGLQGDIDSALSIAESGADKLSSAISDALKTPDIAPVTEAFTQVSEAGKDLASNLTGVLNVDLGTPDTSAFTDAVSALDPMAQDIAQSVAGDFGISLEAPDTGAVSDALGGIQDEAEADAAAMAGATGVSLEAPDAAPVVETLGGIDEVAAASADAMSADFGVTLQAPDATPVTEAIGTIGDASTQASGEMAALTGDFDTDVANMVAAGSTLEEAIKAALGVPDTTPLMDALASVQTEEDKVGQSATQLGADLGKVGDGASNATPDVKTLNDEIGHTGEKAQSAESGLDGMAKQMVALGEALAITQGLREFGMAALEANDRVDDATFAIGKLGGGAEVAEGTIAKLRDVAKDEALSFPQTVTAAQRMTAFLGTAEPVPGIIEHLGNAASVLGTNLDSASASFTKIITSGDLSARSLKGLGLTLDDVAQALGTTDAKAKDAFKSLDQSEKIAILEQAMSKFNGTAKAMNDDALGNLVRLGQEWEGTLEAIGKALDPVIKQIAGFVTADIVAPIRSLAEEFAKLPTPIKDVGVGLGLLVAAIVPVTAAISAAGFAMIGLKEAASILGITSAATATEEGALAIANTAVGTTAGEAAVAEGTLATATETAGAAAATAAGESGIGGLVGSLGLIAPAVALAAGAFAAWKLDDVSGSIDQFKKSVDAAFGESLDATVKGVTDAFRAFTDQLKDVSGFDAIKPELAAISNLLKTLSDESLATLSGSLDGIKEHFSSLADIISKLTGPIGAFRDALKDSAAVMDYLTGRSDSMADAIAKLHASMMEGAKQAAELSRQTDAVGTSFSAAQIAAEGQKAKMEALKSAVDSAYESLKKIEQQALDGKKSTEDVAAAYDKWQSATKALQAAHEALAPVITKTFEAHKQFIDSSTLGVSAEQAEADAIAAHQAKLDSLQQSIDHVTSNLNVQNLQLRQAKENYDLWGGSLADVEKAQKRVSDAEELLNKLQKELDSQLGNTSIPGMKSLKDALDKVNQAWFDGQRGLTQILSALGPTQQAFKDLGLSVDGVAASAKNNLIPAFDQVASDANTTLPQVRAAWEAVSGAVSKLAKTDLPAAIEQERLHTQALIDKKAPLQEVLQSERDIDSNIAKMAQADLPAAIAAEQQHLEELQKIPGAQQEIIRSQQSLLQYEIQWAHQTGQDASDYLIKLDALKEKLSGANTDSIYQAYVSVKTIGVGAFQELGKAVSDTLLDAKDFGDAMVGIEKKIAEGLIDTVINLGLNPVKKGLEDLTNTQLPNAGKAAAVTAQGISGLAAAAATSADRISGMSASIDNTVTDLGHFTGAMDGSITHISGLTGATDKCVTQIGDLTGASGDSADSLGSLSSAATTAASKLSGLGGGGGNADLGGIVTLATSAIAGLGSVFTIMNEDSQKTSAFQTALIATINGWNLNDPQFIHRLSELLGVQITQPVIDAFNTLNGLTKDGTSVAKATGDQIAAAVAKEQGVIDKLTATQTGLQQAITIAIANGDNGLAQILGGLLAGIDGQIKDAQKLLDGINTSSGETATATKTLSAQETAVAADTKALSEAIKSGDIAAISKATADLTAAMAGNTITLADAEKEVSAAIVSGNADDLSKAVSDLQGALDRQTADTQKQTADQTAAELAGLGDVKASTDQITAAIKTEQGKLDDLKAQQAQLGQDLAIAVAEGNKPLADAIETKMGTVASEITAAQGTLDKLNALTQTQTEATITGFSGVKASADQIAAAMQTASDNVANLQGQLDDLNQQLIVAEADGNTALVNAINTQITQTNSELTQANATLSAIESATGTKAETSPPGWVAGMTASAADVAQAVDNLKADIASLTAQQADLNQQLIVAEAAGNTSLVSTIQGELSKVGSQISADNALLAQINTAAGSLNPSLQHLSVDQKLAIDNATKAVNDLQAHSDDLNAQLIRAEAANANGRNQAVVDELKKQIGQTNSQLSDAKNTLKGIEDAIKAGLGATNTQGGAATGGAGAGASPFSALSIPGGGQWWQNLEAIVNGSSDSRKTEINKLITDAIGDKSGTTQTVEDLVQALAMAVHDGNKDQVDKLNALVATVFSKAVGGGTNAGTGQNQILPPGTAQLKDSLTGGPGSGTGTGDSGASGSQNQLLPPETQKLLDGQHETDKTIADEEEKTRITLREEGDKTRSEYSDGREKVKQAYEESQGATRKTITDDGTETRATIDRMSTGLQREVHDGRDDARDQLAELRNIRGSVDSTRDDTKELRTNSRRGADASEKTADNTQKTADNTGKAADDAQQTADDTREIKRQSQRTADKVDATPKAVTDLGSVVEKTGREDAVLVVTSIQNIAAVLGPQLDSLISDADRLVTDYDALKNALDAISIDVGEIKTDSDASVPILSDTRDAIDKILIDVDDETNNIRAIKEQIDHVYVDLDALWNLSNSVLPDIDKQVTDLSGKLIEQMKADVLALSAKLDDIAASISGAIQQLSGNIQNDANGIIKAVNALAVTLDKDLVAGFNAVSSTIALAANSIVAAVGAMAGAIQKAAQETADATTRSGNKTADAATGAGAKAKAAADQTTGAVVNLPPAIVPPLVQSNLSLGGLITGAGDKNADATNSNTGSVKQDTGNTTAQTKTNTDAIYNVGGNIKDGLDAIAVQQLKPTAYDPAAAAALFARFTQGGGSGLGMAGSPEQTLWANTNQASTLQSFFHQLYTTDKGGFAYTTNELPDAVKALADLAKQLQMSIPIGIDAANRLTYINPQGALSTQQTISGHAGLADTTQTVGSRTFTGAGSLDYSTIAAGDPGFKADPALWNKLVAALLATGITQFNADSLAAAINNANDQTNNSNKNLPISGATLSTIPDWLKAVGELLAGATPNISTDQSPKTTAPTGGTTPTQQKPPASTASPGPPVSDQTITGSSAGSTPPISSSSGSSTATGSVTFSGDQSGILSQIDNDLRTGFTAVVDAIKGTTEAIDFGTSVSQKTAAAVSSSAASGGVSLDQAAASLGPAGNQSLAASGGKGGAPPPPNPQLHDITQPFVDLTKTLGKEAHSALIGAGQSDSDKKIADLEADLYRWKSIGSESHIAQAMAALEAAKQEAANAKPPASYASPGPALHDPSDLATVLNNAAANMAPGSVKIPSSTLSSVLNDALASIPPGSIKIPALPKVTIPDVPNLDGTAGNIVINNPTFNLQGVANPRDLWKQLMNEAKKLTPTAVPYSQ